MCLQRPGLRSVPPWLLKTVSIGKLFQSLPLLMVSLGIKSTPTLPYLKCFHDLKQISDFKQQKINVVSSLSQQDKISLFPIKMSLFDIFQSVLTTHFNLVSIFQQFPELCYVKVLMLSQNFCNRSLRVKNFVCFQYLMIQFSGIHHFNGVVLSLSGLPASQVLAVSLTGGGGHRLP